MAWPATTLPIVVEAYLGGAWVDIHSLSTGTRVRGDTRVRITYGGTDETPRVLAGSAVFAVNDPDSLFSGLNPNSPYYGDLGLNTPVRVMAAGVARHYGEIGDLKPVADETENDRYVNVSTRGILSRLTQGKRALRPALERSTLSRSPFSYWQMVDGSGTNVFANSVSGQPNITNGGLIVAAAVDGPAGAPSSLPEMVNEDIVTTTEAGVGPVIGSSGDSWIFDFVHRGVDDGTNNAEATPWTWSTAHMDWAITIVNGAGQVTLDGVDLDGSGADISITASVSTPIDGEWHQYRVLCSQSGSTATVTLYRDGSSIGSDSKSGRSGDFDHVHPMAEPPAAISHLNSSSTGHATVYADVVTGTTYTAAFGYVGETVVGRLTRLCLEEGVPLTVIGNDNPLHTMGPQAAGRLGDIFQHCADRGQGILHEAIDAVGVVYRTIDSLYNQDPALEIDFTDAVFSPPFSPTYNDRFLNNDVTVTRPNGGSARAVLDDDSRMSISDPPTGVGVYDRGDRQVYAETDDQLAAVAYWIMHLGTYNGYRYPQLTLQQQRDVWLNDAAATADLRALRIGDDVRVNNVPERLREIEPLVRLQTRGWTEDLSRFGWETTVNLVPGWLWEVWELDSGGSTLVIGVNSSATSLKLDTITGPPWSTTAEPYHLQIDGEAVTVTAMSMDTASFVGAGAGATGNNASLNPALHASTSEGDLVIVYASIRSSGAGTPTAPAGYTTLLDMSNARVFAKYAASGEAAPTVTFSGGAAGDDTLAQCATFRNLSMRLDISAKSTGFNTVLSGSAQNIAHPSVTQRRDGCMIIFFGWKQDDWTSVATLGGCTEIGEVTSIAGNDAGQVWDFIYEATGPVSIGSGSFTVTGGASAISRGGIIVLRPTQTATVTRAVNGVSKSLAAFKPVTGWRMGAIAL